MLLWVRRAPGRRGGGHEDEGVGELGCGGWVLREKFWRDRCLFVRVILVSGGGGFEYGGVWVCAGAGGTIEVVGVYKSLTTSSTSSTSSTMHESTGTGGTPLDVVQQAAGVKTRAGSLLDLAIIAFCRRCGFLNLEFWPFGSA